MGINITGSRNIKDNNMISKLRRYAIIKKANKRAAQVSLEITFAFIVIFMLFFSSTKIFAWFCNSLTNRQMAYEASRDIYNRDPRDGAQVQPTDVADLDSYLHNRSAPYYNPPLTLVDDGAGGSGGSGGRIIIR